MPTESKLPPGATPVQHTQFPYVPARWAEIAPFAIATGAKFGPTSGRCHVKIAHYTRDRYGVEVGNPGDMHRMMLDANGHVHMSVPGYKLHNPPLFEDFDAAVRVADAWADGTTEVVIAHEDRVRYYVTGEGTDHTYRTLWNDEIDTAEADNWLTYDDWETAKKQADRRNAAAKAKRTRAARKVS